jgi:protein-S-isoprenylcysteine O-methyltransferase Ste14
MFGQKFRSDDPRPLSAVSNGVGRYSALAACLACAIPMVIWSLLMDKVHLRPSTGMKWDSPKSLKETFDVSLVKLAGLWATWGIIATIYCVGRWYWTGQYQFSMEIMETAAPWLFVLSIPYVLFMDRFTIEPRDGAWHFGQLLTGRRSEFEWEQIFHHLRAWAVKGFFLAFMLSIVPGGFADLVRLDLDELAGNPVAIAHWLIIAMFVVDVQFATVGYLLTMKPLDAHIRTANPYMAGWVAALICYPPFILMGNDGPLNYHINTADWAYWFEGQTTILWIWGGILVFLTSIYAWATVAFGLRFSNLTHRGILTHGPYSWTKHPAYVAKNAYWWLATMPFLVTSGSLTDFVRNTVLIAAVSGVYYWRAKTEEKHLLSDPAYKEYAEWMDRNAPIPRLLNWIKRRIGWWTPGKGHTTEIQPAE